MAPTQAVGNGQPRSPTSPRSMGSIRTLASHSNGDIEKALASPRSLASFTTLVSPREAKSFESFNEKIKRGSTHETTCEAVPQQARNTAPAPSPISPPPDGGWLAWAQCAGSFFLFFNCWGIVNTFGVFQTFYETSLYPDSSSSAISWIGSTQAFLLMFGGFLTAPFFDRGHLRVLLCGGTFLVVLGMMMTSLCTSYWQTLLAQGFCVGLGCGCLFVPSVAILPTYFSRRKALALGIGAAGSSLGGIIYPTIFHQVQPVIGFAWTTRLLGFIMLATLTIPLAVMKVRLVPPKSRSYFDATPWLDLPYTLYNIGVFFAFMGVYVPFFYVQLYAISNGLVSPELGFNLLAIMNAGSFFGRIFPPALADRIGPMNVLTLCGLVSTVLGFCMSSLSSGAAVIAFCALFGFFTGSFVSLPPAVIVNLSPSPSGIGVRLGMLFVSISFGLLVGNPVAGAILASGHGWLGLSVFCGATVTIAMVFVAAARVAKYGWSLAAKG